MTFRYCLLSIIFILTSFSLSAQINTDLELDTVNFHGKYKGKNLFVKNSFAGEHGFSVQSVSINDEMLELEEHNASSFEVKFNKRNMSLEDDLTIMVIHIKGMKPEFLNAHEFE